MQCEDVRLRLSAYLDDELEAPLAGRVAAHLEHCRQCREELEGLDGVDSLIKQLPPLSLSADFTRNLLFGLRAAVSREPQRFSLRRLGKTLSQYAEQFFQLLEPETYSRVLSLDEFGDMPTSFIGHAYFKAFGLQR